MTMLNKAQILQLLEARDGRALRDLWRGRSAVDIAALLDTVEDPRRQAALFRTLPKKAAADVFAYLPGPTQARLAASFAEGELQELFDGLQPDDAADLLEELPADLVDRILRAASPQRRLAVNALLRYPAYSDSVWGTVGVKYVRVDVEDSGPGVPEENRSKLFTPKFTTKSRGSGLGLAICRSIVEQVGGTIMYFTSEELGGADFRVIIPEIVTSA